MSRYACNFFTYIGRYISKEVGIALVFYFIPTLNVFVFSGKNCTSSLLSCYYYSFISCKITKQSRGEGYLLDGYMFFKIR